MNILKMLVPKLNGHHIANKKGEVERVGVFISIPRNASNTIRTILKLGPNRDQENTQSLVVHENHQRSAILHQKYDLNRLFVFCFSRNPYDRCVSWYQYHRKIEPYALLSFESWIKHGMPHHWTIQNQTNYLSEHLSPLLQYTFIEHCKVDATGKIESFSQDMNMIIEKLNTRCQERQVRHKFRYSRKRLNKSIWACDYEHYYSKETKEIVYSLLYKDFQHFGYEK